MDKVRTPLANFDFYKAKVSLSGKISLFRTELATRKKIGFSFNITEVWLSAVVIEGPSAYFTVGKRNGPGKQEVLAATEELPLLMELRRHLLNLKRQCEARKGIMRIPVLYKQHWAPQTSIFAERIQSGELVVTRIWDTVVFDQQDQPQLLCNSATPITITTESLGVAGTRVNIRSDQGGQDYVVGPEHEESLQALIREVNNWGANWAKRKK